MSKGRKKKMTYLDYFTKREEKNIQKTIKYFPKELEFWKESFNMLFDVLKALINSYSEKWSHSKKAILFILLRLIMSTKSSLELLIRGYYFDFLVVQRSIWESLALIQFLSKNETAARKWLESHEVELPKWKLMHHLLPPSSTKKKFKLINKMYAEQSEFVHSSSVAIISEWSRHMNRRKEYLEFPKFQKSAIGETLSTPVSLLAILMLIGMFKEELKESLRIKAKNLAEEKISEWKTRGLLGD